MNNNFLPSFQCPGCAQHRVITIRCTELSVPREVSDVSRLTYIVCGCCLTKMQSENPKVRDRIKATIAKNLNDALSAARQQERDEVAAERERLLAMGKRDEQRRAEGEKERMVQEERRQRARDEARVREKAENRAAVLALSGLPRQLYKPLTAEERKVLNASD